MFWPSPSTLWILFGRRTSILNVHPVKTMNAKLPQFWIASIPEDIRERKEYITYVEFRSRGTSPSSKWTSPSPRDGPPLRLGVDPHAPRTSPSSSSSSGAFASASVGLDHVCETDPCRRQLQKRDACENVHTTIGIEELGFRKKLLTHCHIYLSCMFWQHIISLC